MEHLGPEEPDFGYQPHPPLQRNASVTQSTTARRKAYKRSNAFAASTSAAMVALVNPRLAYLPRPFMLSTLVLGVVLCCLLALGVAQYFFSCSDVCGTPTITALEDEPDSSTCANTTQSYWLQYLTYATSTVTLAKNAYKLQYTVGAAPHVVVSNSLLLAAQYIRSLPTSTFKAAFARSADANAANAYVVEDDVFGFNTSVTAALLGNLMDGTYGASFRLHRKTTPDEVYLSVLANLDSLAVSRTSSVEAGQTSRETVAQFSHHTYSIGYTRTTMLSSTASVRSCLCGGPCQVQMPTSGFTPSSYPWVKEPAYLALALLKAQQDLGYTNLFQYGWTQVPDGDGPTIFDVTRNVDDVVTAARLRQSLRLATRTPVGVTDLEYLAPGNLWAQANATYDSANKLLLAAFASDTLGPYGRACPPAAANLAVADFVVPDPAWLLHAFTAFEAAISALEAMSMMSGWQPRFVSVLQTVTLKCCRTDCMNLLTLAGATLGFVGYVDIVACLLVLCVYAVVRKDITIKRAFALAFGGSDDDPSMSASPLVQGGSHMAAPGGNSGSCNAEDEANDTRSHAGFAPARLARPDDSVAEHGHIMLTGKAM